MKKGEKIKGDSCIKNWEKGLKLASFQAINYTIFARGGGELLKCTKYL